MEMQTPNGAMQMWFTGEYRRSSRTERLVYTESMSDEHGNADIARVNGHARRASRIQRSESTWSTSVAHEMVMTHAGIPSDSPGAAGWSMAFDKLVLRLRALGQ